MEMKFTPNELRNIASYIHMDGSTFEDEGKITDDEMEDTFLGASDALIKLARFLEDKNKRS